MRIAARFDLFDEVRDPCNLVFQLRFRLHGFSPDRRERFETLLKSAAPARSLLSYLSSAVVLKIKNAPRISASGASRAPCHCRDTCAHRTAGKDRNCGPR